MTWSLENMVEVKLAEADDFLKVRETLTRIGIASHKDKKLYQSCHILHKRGKYYLVHFKELFALDGKTANLSENDIARRNTIANLLAEWNLMELVTPDKTKDPVCEISQVKILKHSEKDEWELIPKYTLGKGSGGSSRND